jgi:hypothetical protein
MNRLLLKYHLMPMFLKFPLNHLNLLNHLFPNYRLHLMCPMFLHYPKLRKNPKSPMYPKSHLLLMSLHYLK